MHTGLETDDITHIIPSAFHRMDKVGTKISSAFTFEPIMKVKFKVTFIISGNRVN